MLALTRDHGAAGSSSPAHLLLGPMFLAGGLVVPGGAGGEGIKRLVATAANREAKIKLRAHILRTSGSGIQSVSFFARTISKIVGKIRRKSQEAPAAFKAIFTQPNTEKPAIVSAKSAANVTLCPRRAFQIQEIAEKGFKRTLTLLHERAAVKALPRELRAGQKGAAPKRCTANVRCRKTASTHRRSSRD